MIKSSWPDRQVLVVPNLAGTSGASKRLIVLQLTIDGEVDHALALSPVEARQAAEQIIRRLQALGC